MAKFLKQITSGHIFVWTPLLAQRGDMVVHEPEITGENSGKDEMQPEPDTALSDALKAFRKEVTRKRRTKAGTT